MIKYYQLFLINFSDLTTAVKDCLTDNHDDDDVILFKVPSKQCRNLIAYNKCIKSCVSNDGEGPFNCGPECFAMHCQNKKKL